MNRPLPTRKQFGQLEEELRVRNKQLDAAATRARQAEAKLATMEHKAENYLEIYQSMNTELETLRRKAADDEFNTTTFAPLCPPVKLTIIACCENCGAEDDLTHDHPDVILCRDCEERWNTGNAF
jgi:hypothetical protein